MKIIKVYDDGNVFYYNENNQLHRIDGPAVEYPNGSKEYWENGKRHRVNGPAVVYWDGSKWYWENGERHRINGPAIELSNGTKRYWIDGTEYSEKKYFEKMTEQQDDIVILKGKKYKLVLIED